MNLLDLFVKIGVQDEASDKISGIGSNIKSGFATAGKVAAAGIGLVTTAASAAVTGLLALEKSTEEYRIAQGKLNTAFEAAGMSADSAQQSYNAFYGILGDTDTATEASQLLAKLAQSEQDLSTWTNIAAGVYGTFGDSLPIEGLIESANETSKVGQVTGSLADALNWAGISEDEFNEKLAACSTESERNQLIMQTLSGTYDEASDAFYRNNEALVESRSNQAMLDEALATLGGTVTTVKNKLLSEFIPSLSSVATAVSGMLTGVSGSDEQFSAAIQGFIDKIIAKLPEFLNIGTQVITALVSGIVQSIPTLIASIPEIITQLVTAFSSLGNQMLDTGTDLLVQLANGIETGIPDMISKLPTIISNFLSYITDQLPMVLEKGTEILNSLVNGILEAIPEFVSQLPEIITSFVEYFTENFPKIIETGIEIIINLIAGIIKAIPKLVAAIPQLIMALINGIISMLGSIIDVGRQIVEGIREGIANAWESLKSWVVSKFQNLIDSVTGFLGIQSPSKLFAGIGENMALGLKEGWDKSFSDVKKDIDGGLDFASTPIKLNGAKLGTGYNGIYGVTINVTVESGVVSNSSDASALGRVIGESVVRQIRYKGGVAFA